MAKKDRYPCYDPPLSVVDRRGNAVEFKVKMAGRGRNRLVAIPQRNFGNWLTKEALAQAVQREGKPVIRPKKRGRKANDDG